MVDGWPRLIDRRQTKISEWLEVIAKDVQFSPVSAVETYYAIAQRPYLAALAVTPENRILLVRQYRPAIERFIVELPGGLLETGEAPADAMVRELREETGYSTRSITLIGKSATCSSRIENSMYSFFIEAGEQAHDFVEEPGVAVSSASPAELRTLILSSEFGEQTHLGVIALALCQGHISF
jgi:ADP-ribose pyrophosphatase